MRASNRSFRTSPDAVRELLYLLAMLFVTLIITFSLTLPLIVALVRGLPLTDTPRAWLFVILTAVAGAALSALMRIITKEMFGSDEGPLILLQIMFCGLSAVLMVPAYVNYTVSKDWNAVTGLIKLTDTFVEVDWTKTLVAAIVFGGATAVGMFVEWVLASPEN